MFFEFLRFELRYWFRGSMVYIFFSILSLLFLSAALSDQITVGQAIGNTYRNAPYVIQMYYAIGGIFAGIMATAFIDSAASRDFACRSNEILFTKPLKKTPYLLGRFAGSLIAATFPLLGVSAGVLLAGFYPWNDPVRWGPIHWTAHLSSILIFAIPNVLLFGSVVFTISIWTRSTLYSFIGIILFLVAYAVAGIYLEELENETLGAMLDPLGFGAFSIMTKYWTVEEKNSLAIGLSGLMLANRALWLSVVAGLVALAYFSFSFAERNSQRSAKVKEEVQPRVPSRLTLEPVRAASPWRIQWAQFVSHWKSDYHGVLRSTVFLVLLACSLLNMIPSVWFNSTELFGLTTFPVTYQIVELIRGSLLAFVMAILAYFGGVVVWRDRDCKFHEILGALPHRNGPQYLSRLLSLVFIVAVILTLGIATGVSAQMASNYYRFQLGVYFAEFMVIDLMKLSFLAVLAILIHSLAPNKYVGYFLFILFVIVNAFVWGLLRVDSLLVKFGRIPSYTYSDFFQFDPYLPGMIAFGIYWIVVCTILAWMTIQFMHRGVASPLGERIQKRWSTVSSRSKQFLLLFIGCWAAIGGWLYYQTQILNRVQNSKKLELLQVAYEKTYKSLEGETQPHIVDVHYDIEVFPESRNLVMKGKQTLVNKSEQPISKLYLSPSLDYETTVEIENAKEEKVDKELYFRTYRFDPPLPPGESVAMTFEVRSNTRGIENSVSDLSIMPNGTFFNSSIAPSIGYSAEREINNPNRRRDYQLPPSGYPPLTQEKGAPCMKHYIGNFSDWVNIETVISTSADQTAVAPGSLVEKWSKEGRNYFRYKVDHPSLNFYSFISAKYEVKRDRWNDVDLEVYYLPEHQWNVDKMLKSMHKSLEYCSKHFGPYRHKQARIIEFPRVASFAQAFPGTMPYSESIGFIANLTDPEDIDMVYYVVAHEMAHQWWAHQVIGAKMQGATLLSETMAQYSALMVMEEEYGRDMMRKFLSYEVDRYLKGRGRESREERPLLRVEPDQGYIHYNKGSVVLYYLKEMIGEERVNLALKSLIDDFGYKNPPYPNAYDMTNALKKHIPDELQYLIKDLFEEITLYGNRTTEAKFSQDGEKYKVSIDIECSKFRAGERGLETEVPLSDWIEIGGYGKPEKGKKIGKLLFRKRVFIDQKTTHHEFVVDEEPDKVGVDPLSLLIDRMPSDNLKRAERKEAIQGQ